MGRPRDYYRSSKTIGDCGAVQSCCNPPSQACEFGRCCFNVDGQGGYCQHTRKDECDFFPGGYFFPGLSCSGFYGLGDLCNPLTEYSNPNLIRWLPDLEYYYPNPRPNSSYPAVFLPKDSGCTCTPVSCFVSGVKVKTPEGYQNIENISIGDLVCTPSGVTKVSGLTRPVLGNRKLISLNDSDYFFTEDHPIKTPEGFKAVNAEMSIINYDYVDVIGDLKVGDWVITEHGSGLVEKINSKEDEYHTQLYDLKLEEFNEFYAEDFLFHNCGLPGPPHVCWSGTYSTDCQLPYQIQQSFTIVDLKDASREFSGTRTILITESGCYPNYIYCENLKIRADFDRLNIGINDTEIGKTNDLNKVLRYYTPTHSAIEIDLCVRGDLYDCMGKCCDDRYDGGSTGWWGNRCGRDRSQFNPETDDKNGCPIRNPPILGSCCSGINGTLGSCFDQVTFEECKQANDANGTLSQFTSNPSVYFKNGYCFQNPCGIQEGCCLECTTLTQVYLDPPTNSISYWNCDGVTQTQITGANACDYCSNGTGGTYNGSNGPKGLCCYQGSYCYAGFASPNFSYPPDIEDWNGGITLLDSDGTTINGYCRLSKQLDDLT